MYTESYIVSERSSRSALVVANILNTTSLIFLTPPPNWNPVFSNPVISIVTIGNSGGSVPGQASKRAT